jgi:hypothetical protein
VAVAITVGFAVGGAPIAIRVLEEPKKRILFWVHRIG